MIYAIIGIPLTMIFLANIGKIMSRTVMVAYSRCFCRWCRVRRKKSELEGKEGDWDDSKPFTIRDEEVGEEEYMPTDKTVIEPTALMSVPAGISIFFFSWPFRSPSAWRLWRHMWSAAE